MADSISQPSPVTKESLNQKIDSLDLTLPDAPDPEHYRAIAHLWAYGGNHGDIATMLAISVEDVKNILSLERVKKLAFEIKKKHAGRDFDRLFKNLVPDATDVVHHIMNDPKVKDSTRLTAALAIVDRAMGRPTQKLEVGGSLIRDLFDRLDALEKSGDTQAIEAESKRLHTVEDGEFTEAGAAAPVQQEGSKLDQWVKDNIK